MSEQERKAQPGRFSLTALIRAEVQKPDEDDPTVTKGQKVAEQMLLYFARRGRVSGQPGREMSANVRL